MIIQPQPKFI